MIMDPFYHSPGGITIRQDQEALFGYLPKEGFAFFAPASEYVQLKDLLTSQSVSGFPPGYERFTKKKIRPFFPPQTARSLGDPNHVWETLPLPEAPLVINWMITGACNHHCAYCYAQDVMNAEADPSDKTILSIIETLKGYQPVAVVLTGGEPSLSPYLTLAIDALSKFTSVVVDTNATALSLEHINKFISNDVHVRISLDSNRNIINSKTRKPKKSKESISMFEKVWTNISLLSSKNVPLTINTVATTYNYDDIQGLEKNLSRFNVSKLRIRLVEQSKLISNFAKLTGSESRINRFLKYTTEKVSEDFSIPIYISIKRPRNSVVIVSPNGSFYTESQFVEQGKILIDSENPTKPTLDNIRKRVDMHAHSARYLFV